MINTDYQYQVSLPTETPTGQSVSIESKERSGRHMMHAESPDQSECYFEVLAYEALIDHDALIQEQQTFLRENAVDSTISEGVHQRLYHLEGSLFDFRGTLQNRWKERRFFFVDGPRRTYRVVFDPTSDLNIRVLQTLQLGNN